MDREAEEQDLKSVAVHFLTGKTGGAVRYIQFSFIFQIKMPMPRCMIRKYNRFDYIEDVYLLQYSAK